MFRFNDVVEKPDNESVANHKESKTLVFKQALEIKNPISPDRYKCMCPFPVGSGSFFLQSVHPGAPSTWGVFSSLAVSIAHPSLPYLPET